MQSFDASAPSRGARKDDHVELALKQRENAAAYGQHPHTDFDDISFVHHALAGINHSDVSLRTSIADLPLSMPLYINGMTGGTEKTAALNRELAIAAAETGIPVASGSVSIALDDPATAESFRVLRQENPFGLVFANIGVERSGDDAVRAVELLAADALQVHINAVQETVMPEGSRNFSSWLNSLEQIVSRSPAPVIVKEVGFGLSGKTRTRLQDLGVEIVDVAGRGGTDFLRIENARRSAQDFAYLTGFGLSAVECLLDTPVGLTQVTLASGGVRNPLDVVKCLALGAQAVGVAGTFLAAVHSEGAEGLIKLINSWRDHLTALFALLGCQSVADLQHTDLLVHGRVAEFCAQNRIDTARFTLRSESKGVSK